MDAPLLPDSKSAKYWTVGPVDPNDDPLTVILFPLLTVPDMPLMDGAAKAFVLILKRPRMITTEEMSCFLEVGIIIRHQFTPSPVGVAGGVVSVPPCVIVPADRVPVPPVPVSEKISMSSQ